MFRTELVYGDTIKVGAVLITLEKKSGARARLCIRTEDGKPIEILRVGAENSQPNPILQIEDVIRIG